MTTASRTIGFRSRAQSLVRFAEALKRAKTAPGVVSLARAHTPHTPQGRALKRRPGSLVRARSSAQASERSRTGVVAPCRDMARVDQRGRLGSPDATRRAVGRCWGGVCAGGHGRPSERARGGEGGIESSADVQVTDAMAVREFSRVLQCPPGGGRGRGLGGGGSDGNKRPRRRGARLACALGLRRWLGASRACVDPPRQCQ
jgi:hypothetical protein